MAHNLCIDEKSGEASLYLLKKHAWHNLGQTVEEAKNSDEVLKIAHLDFTVAKTPDFVRLNGLEVPNGLMSTYRTDNFALLGRGMTDEYTIMQNAETFAFMDSLVINNRDIVYNTAGALGAGEVTFVTAKLPGYIRIKGSSEVIEKYLLLTNSHNRATKLIMQFTDIDVVCNNTLDLALKDRSNRVTLRHTASAMSRLEEGRKLLNLALSYQDELEVVLNRLAEVKVTEEYIKNFIPNLFLKPEDLKKLAEGELSTRQTNMLDTIRESLEVAPGQERFKGTALNLYNGVTSYFQNVKEYKSEERKMAGIQFFGAEGQIAQKAFNTLLQLA